MKENLIYGFTEEVNELAEMYLERDILCNQTMLINEILSNHPEGIVGITYDNITNLYNSEEETQDIYEWWLVSKWLAEELEKSGEPILAGDYDCYWGRTATGQDIILDGTIQEIAKKFI